MTTSSLDWSGGRIIPAFQPIQDLSVFDVQSASREAQLTLAVLVGIINRPCPRVYLLTAGDDLAWLDLALKSIPRALASARGDAALLALIEAYLPDIKGLIIYDPGLIDTINVATTMAGQRDGLVVSPVQAQNFASSYHLPVLADLRIFQWRTRLQAYRWAQEHLLEGASRRLIAGLDPHVTTGLRSFLVATRTFVYWLDSRNYLPDLRDGLLSERTLMRQILHSYPADAVHLGWFIDESSGVNLTSIAGIPVLASDYFTNMEVWAASQPVSFNEHSARESMHASDRKIYISFVISDGDNLQYVQHRMLHLWSDQQRGRFPVGWTLSPVLLQAAPAMAAYYKNTATPNDELVAGPSGAGYIFPSCWPADQVSPFLQATGQLMQQLDMTTLEVLDTTFWQSSGLPLISQIHLTGMNFKEEGRQQRFVRELRLYGLRGILSGAGVVWPMWKKVDGMPLCHNLGLASSVKGAVRLIQAAALTHIRRPLFLSIYMLAWSISLADIKEIARQLGSGYEVVLPRILLSMLARTI